MHSHQFSDLESLPTEMLVDIFLLLNAKDLASVLLVSQTFYAHGKITFNIWENRLKENYVLFYEFIKSTRGTKSINWQEEYITVEKELETKLGLDFFTPGTVDNIYKKLNVDIIKIIRKNEIKEFEIYFSNADKKRHWFS